MTSRWGEGDESGARNLIDAAATLRGIASVRTGEVIPLSLPIVGGSRGAAMPNGSNSTRCSQAA